jgi:hypothetical protein
VTSVEAWSMGRYLDLYSITVTGSAGAVVQQYQASGDFVRASPYLPKGDKGGVHQASELESLLLNGSRFALFAEIFGEVLPFGFERFGDLVATPSPPFVPGAHFTRAEGLLNTTTVHTPQDASNLKARIDSTRPILYRVIAR